MRLRIFLDQPSIFHVKTRKSRASGSPDLSVKSLNRLNPRPERRRRQVWGWGPPRGGAGAGAGAVGRCPSSGAWGCRRALLVGGATRGCGRPGGVGGPGVGGHGAPGWEPGVGPGVGGLGEGVDGGVRLEARLPHRRGRGVGPGGGMAVLKRRAVVRGAVPAALWGRASPGGPPPVGGPWRVGWGAARGAG